MTWTGPCTWTATTATFAVTPEQAYRLAGDAMPEIGAYTELPDSLAQDVPAGRWRITGVTTDLAGNTCWIETTWEPARPSWTLTAEAVDGAPDA